MKNLIILLFATSINISVFAQQSVECGTKSPNEQEVMSRGYVGNNNFLLDVLKSHNINLPDDYFEKIDTKGLYMGRKIPINEVRGKRLGLGGKSLDGQNPDNTTSLLSFGGIGTIYYIPVHIWNHKNSNGYGAMPAAEMYDMLSETFELYRKEVGNIEFYIKDLTYPNNSPYYNLANNENAMNDMFDNYFDSNAMNIHIVNNAPSAGVARNPGTCLYVSKQNRGFATLAHEIGHNFGVEHTHQGRWPCNGDNETCADCWQEPVSRSMGQPAWCGNFNNKKKCEVNGDKLCDTAGEPNIGSYVNVICQYDPGTIGDVTDNWGAIWQPNTRNIMSYSRKVCRDQFTYGQIGVMLDGLSKNRFDFKSTSPQFTISGPSKVCPNQSYTYSTPSQSTTATYYLWQIPLGWSISGQGNRTVTITPILNYVDHRIYVNPIEGGSVASLKLTVDNLTLSISGYSEIPGDNFCRSYRAENYSGANYTWTTSAPAGSGVVICSGQGTNTVYIKAGPNSPSFYLNASASNVCGTTINGSKYITIGNGGDVPIPIAHSGDDDISIYPNPTTKTLKIAEKIGINELDNVSVIDMKTGIEVYQTECLKTNEEIDLRGFPKGTYILRYSINNSIKTKKILKK